MGLFRRKKNQLAPSAEPSRDVLATGIETTQESATPSPLLPTETAVAAGVATDASAGKGLKATAEKMRSKAEGQVTLSLTQSGQDMSYTLYQRGQEVESGTVEPGSEWFSPVADLYVEEEKSERGAWNRALIVVNPALGNMTAVQVSFMNTESSRTHNLNYSLDLSAVDTSKAVVTREPAENLAPEEKAEQLINRVSARLASEQRAGSTEQVVAEESSNLHSALGGEEPSAAPVTAEVQEPSSSLAPETMAVVEEETGPELSSEGYRAQRFAYTGGEDSAAATESLESGSLASARASERDLGADTSSSEEVISEAESETVAEEEVVASEPSQETDGAVHSESANQYPVTGGYYDDAADTSAPEPVSELPSGLTAEVEPEKTGISTSYDQTALPSHIDDSEFGADEEPALTATSSASVLPSTPRKIAAATLDAPMTGASVDVAPSYSEQGQAKPSETKKADGNLVLTEAEVVSRLAPAYEALFGAHGTALDVSTVLIRVRTLGSYYDALTHVRRNGFWEQVRTFDLIPEDILAILQLKADSYKEGYGSPLAINLRFTPGIPVVASFDYADEEAFVRYPEHLPAQQYVEELRMFPRTGANIPAHMSEALASWNF